MGGGRFKCESPAAAMRAPVPHGFTCAFVALALGQRGGWLGWHCRTALQLVAFGVLNGLNVFWTLEFVMPKDGQRSMERKDA